MDEQIITKRNKRRTIQRQIADIYDESKRLGVKNPPTLLHHLEEVGITVTEASKRADARRLEQDRGRLKELRETKAAEAEVKTEAKAVAKVKQATTLKEAVKVVKQVVVKGPSRSEQVLAILQANGATSLTTIAERLTSASRDAAWGATRKLIVEGRAKAVKRQGQETVYEVI